MLRNLENNELLDFFFYKVKIVREDGSVVWDTDDKPLTVSSVKELIGDTKCEISKISVCSLSNRGKKYFEFVFSEYMRKICPFYSENTMWATPWFILNNIDDYVSGVVQDRLLHGFYDEGSAISKAAQIFSDKAYVAWMMSGKNENFFD